MVYVAGSDKDVQGEEQTEKIMVDHYSQLRFGVTIRVSKRLLPETTENNCVRSSELASHRINSGIGVVRRY